MLRLSEAIREGCKYGPQLYGALLDGKGGSCAWGSVALVMGAPTWYGIVRDTYKWAFYAHVIPACSCVATLCDVAGHIVHLNNFHCWTREAIAEWVETVERKLGLWDEVPKVETVKQETRTEYEVKPREYSFK